MTSPLKVDLIIHCAADQYGCRRSVYTLFLLRFFSFSVNSFYFFFTSSDKASKKRRFRGRLGENGERKRHLNVIAHLDSDMPAQ